MARLCDGTDDYLNGGVSQLATGSIAFWFKLIAAPASDTHAVGMGEAPGDGTMDKNLHIQTDRTAAWYVHDGAGLWTFPRSPALTLGQWYPMLGTFDGTTSRHYVGGSEIGTVLAGSTFTGYASPEFIVGNIEPVFINCAVAEPAIWSSILSASDAVSLATLGTAPDTISPGTLLDYWPILGDASPEPNEIGGRNSLSVVGAIQTEHPWSGATPSVNPSYSSFPRYLHAGRNTV